MHLEAVPMLSAQGFRVNAPQVAPQAGAVAEAVMASSLALGGHHKPAGCESVQLEANTPIALATASSSPASSVQFP